MYVMQKKNLATFLLVFLSISFIAFIGITQILGIPLWWIFGFLKPLSIVPTPKLLVTVSPETPLSIGETITVTVINSSSRLPVKDAEVSVKKDGMHITLNTDSEGKASFEYFGAVTVVVAKKTGIESSTPVAIPKIPDAWVINTIVSLGSAVVGGVVGAFALHMFQQRRKKTEKRATRKAKRKETTKS